MGHDLAVWRADDGFVNVWENRCLHRGVRLSIGINTGAELVCQYHGWRYASRTAGCTYIPAHPADAPARTVCNRTYPVLERGGLVWTHLAEVDPPEPDAPEGALILRALPVEAAPRFAVDWLTGWAPEGFAAGAPLSWEGEAGFLRIRVQPADGHKAILRGVVEGPSGDRMALLLQLDAALEEARRRIEAEAELAPPAEPIALVYPPLPAELAGLPEKVGAKGALRVRIAAKEPAGEDVIALHLAPLGGALPAFQPGAHLDLHLPGGLTRQYSLVNGPGESAAYVVGVKRDPASSGGSRAIHDDLRVGDVIAISEPRNNFPLRRDALRTLFLAGGIGATPLLSMAAALQASNLPFEFHLFARSKAQVPFPERVAALGVAVTRYLGLDADSVRGTVRRLVAEPGHARHLYVCGPVPMLELVREEAAAAGWKDQAVHFEYFANPNAIDDGTAFEVALARSALTLPVPAGRSILSVLRQNGIEIPASCEQGACGTCAATVLEGDPDHQDVYLNATERREGRRIMTCVSRARSARIVLDL